MNVAAVRPSASGASLLSLRRPLSLLKQTLSLLPRSAKCDVHRPDLLCPLHVCAVRRRRFPVGARPTRPNAPGAHDLKAWMLTSQARFDEAIAERERPRNWDSNR